MILLRQQIGEMFEMKRIINYEIGQEYDSLKIFTYLKYKKGFSTKLIRTLKNTENGIILNGSPARTVDLIKPGDVLTVSVPEDGTAPEPVKSELEIIYEDEDILIVNKSPYTAMHPTHNHQGDTLANAVAAPAVDFRSEGWVTGTAVRMFTIAGPVIVYGVSASVLYGAVLLLGVG